MERFTEKETTDEDTVEFEPVFDEPTDEEIDQLIAKMKLPTKNNAWHRLD